MIDPSEEEKPPFDENSPECIRQLLLSYVHKVGQVYRDDESVQKAVSRLEETLSKPFE